MLVLCIPKLHPAAPPPLVPSWWLWPAQGWICPWKAALALLCLCALLPGGWVTGWLLLPKTCGFAAAKPVSIWRQRDGGPLAAPLGAVPNSMCWWPHLLFTHGRGREGEKEGGSSCGRSQHKDVFSSIPKGGESHHDSSGVNIVSCENQYWMSLMVSPIPPSPHSLSAFFSLTKDESKRPKYKELLVSAKCGCPCLSSAGHTAGLGLMAKVTPCLLGPPRQHVQLHSVRRRSPVSLLAALSCKCLQHTGWECSGKIRPEGAWLWSGTPAEPVCGGGSKGGNAVVLLGWVSHTWQPCTFKELVASSP